MSDQGSGNLSDFSMLDLFRIEAEGQTKILKQSLLEFEREFTDDQLSNLMRAAHSLKGAARMVDVAPAVTLAGCLEEGFIAAQEGLVYYQEEHVKLFLQAAEILEEIAQCPGAELPAWNSANSTRVDELRSRIAAIAEGESETAATQTSTTPEPPPAPEEEATNATDSAELSLADASMMDLFRIEIEGQAQLLSEGLLELEDDPNNPDPLETLMRAAHSIKGAARMVDVGIAVEVAHVMEDCFVAAQEEQIEFEAVHIDILLRSIDTLTEIAEATAGDYTAWLAAQKDSIKILITALKGILNGEATELPAPAAAGSAPTSSTPAPMSTPTPTQPPTPITVDPCLADESMLELFRIEVEAQSQLLTAGLLGLEKDPSATDELESMMRAAHSMKGAARMVGIDVGVTVAHVMEDCFVAAQEHKISFTAEHVDLLLQGVDTLTQIAQSTTDNFVVWLTENAANVQVLGTNLQRILDPNATELIVAAPAAAKPKAKKKEGSSPRRRAQDKETHKDNAIRVSSESLNRLMGLAGEVRVESKWLHPFSESLVQVKHRQAELISTLDKLWELLSLTHMDEGTERILNEAQHRANQCRSILSDRLGELEEYDRRSHSLANRLNREVIASRMRPFSDGVHGFQRMVRDMSRSLGKNVHLEIHGLNTKVDRDILEKIEAPLTHLVRNAVDHGIEMPEDRVASDKPEQATIRLESSHKAGMLSILVQDDGRGIDLEKLRAKIIDKGMASADMVENMSESELTDFLFLPGFSTRENVTEISGRGVGLDVVHSAVQEMRGVVRAISNPGKGMQFEMQLPLTLSVIRALLVEIGGDPYAFPLARIDRTLKLPKDAIELLEGRQYFTLGSQHIGMVAANQALDLPAGPHADDLSIVVLGERLDRYGLVVDRFLGERNLVVQTLDNRLGKIKDVSTAAILENGVPCLILDVDDLLRSLDLLVAGRRLDKIQRKGVKVEDKIYKKILVVDDSITVREVERKMLTARGYHVEVAVDGMDGWNAVRSGNYDLVISDIDMPRMNGFEFVGLIKQDADLKSLPVMIVSYKDRAEDRQRGLEVGADYYLTKGSFQDDTLLDAVADLIGDA